MTSRVGDRRGSHRPHSLQGSPVLPDSLFCPVLKSSICWGISPSSPHPATHPASSHSPRRFPEFSIAGDTPISFSSSMSHRYPDLSPSPPTCCSSKAPISGRCSTEPAAKTWAPFVQQPPQLRGAPARLPPPSCPHSPPPRPLTTASQT